MVNTSHLHIGAVILCRYDSTRMPGKVLAMIKGKEALAYIYERVCLALPREQIVVATSDESSDEPIVAFCKQNSIQFFRGSKEDVSSRILSCAQHYHFDYLIRICGDNLFIDPKLIHMGISCLAERPYDFVSNVNRRTFPYGQSVEIIKRDFYEKQITRFDRKFYREHVTSYLYENPECGNFKFFYNDICPEASGLRLVLDTPEDFEFLTAVTEQMGKSHMEYGLRELYQLSKQIMSGSGRDE